MKILLPFSEILKRCHGVGAQLETFFLSFHTFDCVAVLFVVLVHSKHMLFIGSVYTMNIQHKKLPATTTARSCFLFCLWENVPDFHCFSLCLLWMQMGVLDLWNNLRKERALRYFDTLNLLVTNRTVALDNSVYVHMVKFHSLNDTARLIPDFGKLVRDLIRMYKAVKYSGAHILVVMDGGVLPGKLAEEAKRHSGRDAIRCCQNLTLLHAHEYHSAPLRTGKNCDKGKICQSQSRSKCSMPTTPH